MRTTVQLDDDIYEAARSLADAEAISLGKALSALARKGLSGQVSIRRKGGIPVFEVSKTAPPLTLERVRAALDDES